MELNCTVFIIHLKTRKLSPWQDRPHDILVKVIMPCKGKQQNYNQYHTISDQCTLSENHGYCEAMQNFYPKKDTFVNGKSYYQT